LQAWFHVINCVPFGVASLGASLDGGFFLKLCYSGFRTDFFKLVLAFSSKGLTLQRIFSLRWTIGSWL
jgi:hypothetical protein